MTENVSHWMHVDVFTVDQAAALWCGHDPATVRSFDCPSEVRAIKQLLTGAIVTDQIQADSSMNGLRMIGDFSTSLISRAELEKFAKAKNLFPAFLFDTLAPFLPQPPSWMRPVLQATETAKAPTLDAPANKGGRPPEYDWDSFTLEIIRLANEPDGLPSSQADVVRHMLQWFMDRYGVEPAESAVKSRTSKIYRYLQEEKPKAKKP